MRKATRTEGEVSGQKLWWVEKNADFQRKKQLEKQNNRRDEKRKTKLTLTKSYREVLVDTMDSLKKERTLDARQRRLMLLSRLRIPKRHL